MCENRDRRSQRAPRGFRGLRAPCSRHGITVRVELRFHIDETFGRLSLRWFYLRVEHWRWPVKVQSMRLSRIPNSEPSCGDRKHRYTDDDQPNDQPNPAYSVPVKCHKNCDWRDENPSRIIAIAMAKSPASPSNGNARSSRNRAARDAPLAGDDAAVFHFVDPIARFGNRRIVRGQ